MDRHDRQSARGRRRRHKALSRRGVHREPRLKLRPETPKVQLVEQDEHRAAEEQGANRRQLHLKGCELMARVRHVLPALGHRREGQAAVVVPDESETPPRLGLKVRTHRAQLLARRVGPTRIFPPVRDCKARVH